MRQARPRSGADHDLACRIPPAIATTRRRRHQVGREAKEEGEAACAREADEDGAPRAHPLDELGREDGGDRHAERVRGEDGAVALLDAQQVGAARGVAREPGREGPERVDGVAGQMSTRMNLNGVYVPGGTEITFRLLCPVSKTGSVIGRNGEVIQQIRSEIGAKIKVCEQVNDADERIICVSSIDDGLAPMISAQVALFRIYRCIVERSPFKLQFLSLSSMDAQPSYS